MVMDECKRKFPGSYIQVKVDVENFQLKLSRLSGRGWINNFDKVDLPESVLDLSRMGVKVTRNKKEARVEDDESWDGEMVQGESKAPPGQLLQPEL
jgi:hypothetical protein